MRCVPSLALRQFLCSTCSNGAFRCQVGSDRVDEQQRGYLRLGSVVARQRVADRGFLRSMVYSLCSR